MTNAEKSNKTKTHTHTKVTIGPGNAEAIGDSDRASANRGDWMPWNGCQRKGETRRDISGYKQLPLGI